MIDANTSAILERARGYPYAFPRHGFLYVDGVIEAFDETLVQGRTPVLAFGSNQSPERLIQKFGSHADHMIPVERAILCDFDVVYSAHITSYGAVPAMLQVSPGARVELAITWLDERQLGIMHKSEVAAANYFFAAVEDVVLETQSGGVYDVAYAYVGTRGHLQHSDGGAIALAAVTCEGRQYSEMTTADALEIVRTRHAENQTPEEFILEMVNDIEKRRRLTDLLARHAVPFDYPVRKLD